MNTWKEGLQQINTYREENNLKPLQQDQDLCRAAEKRLGEIKNNFSHEGFGIELCDKCSHLGENLARNIKEERVVSAWIESPSHKEIIVSPVYNIGCVVYDDGYSVFEAGAGSVGTADRGFFMTPIIIAMIFLKVVRYL